MQLDVLADSNVSDASRISLRQVGDGAQLIRMQEAAGQPDPDHEIRRGLALAAGTAQSSRAITLRVDAPPAEVRLQPGFRNGGKALAGKAADFLKAFPGVFFLLQPLRALCFGLGLRYCLCTHKISC